MTHRAFLPLLLSMALVCAAPAAAQASQVLASEPPMPRPDMSARAAEAMSFAQWRGLFRARALAEGIAPEIFDEAFNGVTPSRRILDRDENQPEHVRSVGDYLAGAASPTRIRNGQTELARRADLLAEIETRYAVDRAAVIAIWGMETAYGAVRGNIDIIRALATLAFEGRRRDWAERELVAAMTILQAGDVAQHQMYGSWAGAMGHTQFMPTSFLNFAQDFTGDGKRDVWGDDPTDALASAAHYLKEHGWVKGAPAMVEVRLPEGFNHLLADRFLARPAVFWNDLGVRTITGAPIPDYGNSEMLMPSGATGPIFLTYANFDAILAYNRSNSYALGIAHLAERIEGGAPFVTPWPEGILPLSRTDRRALQEQLTALGYDTEGADGFIGPNTERAIKRFQMDRGMVPDGYASNQLFARVMAEG